LDNEEELFSSLENVRSSEKSNIVDSLSSSSSIVMNQETLEKFKILMKNTQTGTPLHKTPKHNSLNSLICEITNHEEANLLPKLISQWRQRLLPITFLTTKLLFNRLCDEKIGAENVMFEMLADRKRYGLLPDVEGFRLLMLKYSNKILGDEFWKKNNYFIDEKIKLLLTDLKDDDIQEIIDNNKDKNQNKEESNKNQEKKDNNIEEIEEERVLVEKNKTEPEIYLDKLFKTFGLMTYYDLSQHDSYLFLIILSASMKLNTIESIKRIDISSKEFLELFLNSEKTINSNTLKTTSSDEIIAKSFPKSEKQPHYIESFVEIREKLSILEKENLQYLNKQKILLSSNTLDLMINYYNKLSELEKRDNIEKYKKILQLDYHNLSDGFENLKKNLSF
jgi:hypothetical protein